ncbi:conjugal transfer protein TraD [Bradyrhizobium sp. HKCCYLRH1030]|uniref:conjugal transfer protein TraD n=1 Tax=Bradyrhizobium sp. HKCCYLRH1030 TaxID=3420744 RepID=UPI003EBD9B6F
MRTWQVERRKRTRHLIKLGGLVVKAGLVGFTGDDRATIFGALLWMADKLRSDQAEEARELWVAKGKQALARDTQVNRSNCSCQCRTARGTVVKDEEIDPAERVHDAAANAAKVDLANSRGTRW